VHCVAVYDSPAVSRSVVVICTCQNLSDEKHRLRQWDDSRRRYPLPRLCNLQISEHVLLHHFALPRFYDDSDNRPQFMSTTLLHFTDIWHFRRLHSLSLFTHLHLRNAAAHASYTLILSPALSNTDSPSFSAHPPPPKTLGTLHNPSTYPPSQHCIGTSGLCVLLWRALDPASVA
jgi:hypothetical protein